ncbi:MAG: terpene cyclase/mutase family protein, partial [Planctomycetales bacterium]|nr:terpene cyclase/mutase family protein [Planctomycetales bacterium]
EFENTELMPVETDIQTPEPVEVAANDLEQAAVKIVEFDPLGATSMPNNPSALATVGAFTGSALEGRGSAEGRARLAKAGGGSDASEAAVALALKWIASRQAPDGGWNFNHNLSINPVPCPDPGSAEKARNGATGLALLPFLGSGQTHKEGAYKKQVYAGLAYLIRSMKVTGNTGGWHEAEGSMYSHGIASIAMCEAYAMTHDKELLAPAQLCLNYIVYAQDPVGGGWRYSPRQAGDTSAVGWQLMALKSGHMAYLQVPQGTVLGAMKFLDSVQSESGAKYGYTGPGGGQSTTAVGLLCRMYLGWKKDNPGLQRGVEFIDKTGPSKSGNMYYNYYATQICRHNEGEVWERWNGSMRDWLVGQQAKDGAKAGSWYFRGGDHGCERGGRLYCTAMSTMILEVYYRHLPIYRKQASDEEFKL